MKMEIHNTVIPCHSIPYMMQDMSFNVGQVPKTQKYCHAYYIGTQKAEYRNKQHN